MPSRHKPANRKSPAGKGKSRRSLLARLTWWQKSLISAGIVIFLLFVGLFTYAYIHYSRVIDARLNGNVFKRASVIYAAPEPIQTGEHFSEDNLSARLRAAGYSPQPDGSTVGTYEAASGHLTIRPGPESFFNGPVFQEGPAVLDFRGGSISSITSLKSRTQLQNYWLEPEVITTLFGQNRAKRRVVSYNDLPKVLINAVVAAEDHRFFSHHGVNLLRIAGAAWADLRAQRTVQGGSTITMQLARNFFLTPRRTFRRKVEEIFIAVLLEQRLSKEEIFGLYANEIYLGQLGSFGIYGFGEASNAYFNKDVSRLSLSRAALLAGLIRGPNYYSPYDHPERARDRRNHVLREMVELAQITPAQADVAANAPLGLAKESVQGNQAPYFVDMVKNQLLAHFPEQVLLSQSYRIYTTLDLNLQQAARTAVAKGMDEVDERISHMRHHPKQPANGPKQPQVAIVVLDPHTGALKALVGGRNYSVSQLNHVLARRQPGSSFKPFVYAAALNSAIDGSQPVITPATILNDEPTSFQFGDQVYEPENYMQEYHGQVTLRDALAHSLNVATVELAQEVGYGKIRDLAIAAGINHDIKATPALALGAYVATPLEMAGAYTVFANSGQYEQPNFILSVTDADGKTIYQPPQVSRQVLDPRVDYLLVNMMESVIDEGTGAGVRSRGFMLPAAGKTGTSHDGWFAGFTSNLLTVVWVGYDNDQELNLSGARSALPVWTDFMKAATRLPDYRNAEPFEEPPGIVTEQVDDLGKPVGNDPGVVAHNEFFVQGTQPNPVNPLERVGGILSRIFHPGGESSTTAAAPKPAVPNPSAAQQPATQPKPLSSPPPPKKKGGFFKKMFSFFGGGSKHKKPQK